MSAPLYLDAAARERLWARVVEALAAPAEGRVPVAPRVEPAALASAVARTDFDAPIAVDEAVARAVEGLTRWQVQPTSPRYFGPFTPAPATLAVAAEAIAAGFNPQLATYAHSPFAVEVERALVAGFAARFGFAVDDAEGTFTQGASEATLTALVTSLVAAFPSFAKRGLRSLAREPRVYVSVDGHPSLVKAACVAGIGTAAVRRVPVDKAFRMKPGALAQAIANDRQAGHAPFLVVATAGATTTGAVDPIDAIADVAGRFGCRLHIDAAWGGMAAFTPALAGMLRGCSRADSVGFDPHKALAMPLGTGVYLARRRGELHAAFAAPAAYLPRDSSRDPYAHSLAWSRRFAGLGLWLTLAVSGWQGYADALARQVAAGDRLRDALTSSGWAVVNETRLPVVCFVDRRSKAGTTARALSAIAARVCVRGEAWLSPVRLASGAAALRACVTNPATTENDVDALVRALDEARQSFAAGAAIG